MSETSLQTRDVRGLPLPAALKASLRQQWLLLVLVLTYAVAVYGVLALGGFPFELALGVYVLSALVPPVAAGACVLLGHLLQHLIHVRPFRLSGLARTIREDDKFGAERLALALIPLLLIPLFSSAFTSFKNAIPLIQPFAYDQLFM